MAVTNAALLTVLTEHRKEMNARFDSLQLALTKHTEDDSKRFDDIVNKQSKLITDVSLLNESRARAGRWSGRIWGIASGVAAYLVAWVIERLNK